MDTAAGMEARNCTFNLFQQLKELTEHYAVEAKQTAQRLSAENFKLKEDLSQEWHHSELTQVRVHQSYQALDY